MVLDKQKSAHGFAEKSGKFKLTAEHQRLYRTYLQHFMECLENHPNHMPGIATEVFRCAGEDTPYMMIEKLIDQVVIELYCEHVQNLPRSKMMEYVAYIHRGMVENKNNKSDSPFLFGFSLFEWLGRPEAKKLTNDNTTILYSIMAVMQLNEMIPMMQAKGMGSVALGYVMYLQQTYDQAKSITILDKLLLSLSEHVPPETLTQIMQAIRQQDTKDKAKRGGKAKAEKSHGQAKQYVRKRVQSIQQQHPNKKASKMAEVIYQELREKCGADLNAECPAYDTLYGWVRKCTKGQSF